MPDPRALLNQRVYVRGKYGVKLRGRLVGIVDEPAYIIEKSDGTRVVIAQSATRGVHPSSATG